MRGTGDTSADQHEDLSPVLGHIGWGKLATTRAKLANSLETREFLEIGLGLLQDDLLRHTGPDFDQGERSRLFESLSRERILARAAELDLEKPKLLTVNMFRHRWDRKDRYTEDLISYLFRLGPPRRHLKEMGNAAMALVPKVSFKELVQLLAVAEVEIILADPLINLQSIIQSALPSHPKVRQFSQAQYEIILTGWARLYERVSVSYGLRLRAGVTWPDVALLFNTIVEGVFVRARIDNNEPVLSNGEGILAGAIFVMLPSLVEPLPEDLSTLHAIGGTGCAD